MANFNDTRNVYGQTWAEGDPAQGAGRQPAQNSGPNFVPNFGHHPVRQNDPLNDPRFEQQYEQRSASQYQGQSGGHEQPRSAYQDPYQGQYAPQSQHYDPQYDTHYGQQQGHYEGQYEGQYGAHPQSAYHDDPQYSEQYSDTSEEYYSEDRPGDHGFAPEHGQQGGGNRIVSLIGAVASVALVAGVAIWSYKLVARDVSGVPVVRAAEGPMRIQPEEPGGRPADHQGFAVNRIAAEGTAAPTADRLVLAPRTVGLSAEDDPIDNLQPTPVSLQTGGGPDEAVSSYQQGAVDALVAQLTQGVEPIDTTQQADDPKVDFEDVAAVSPEPLSEEPVTPVVTGPGPARSLRPVVRPADLRTASLNNVTSDAMPGEQTAVAPAILDVDPASLKAGTRLAQLGAYDSAEVAKSEWNRIYARFEDYMKDKQRVIQKASSGGRTFYRLRAMGFDDLNDARRFCSALVAERADCIPVTTR